MAGYILQPHSTDVASLRRQKVETLPELVVEVSRAHRDHPALRIKPAFRTRTWTYGQIGNLVPRVATLLRDSGVTPGDRGLISAVRPPKLINARHGAHSPQALPL